MKWMKRTTALFLCFFLVASGPVSAFEQIGILSMGNTIIEEQQFVPVEGCAECGQLDGHAETCSQYVVAPVLEACAECGLLLGHSDICSQSVMLFAEGCAECGQSDGHAEICSQYAADSVLEACAECGLLLGHSIICSQYSDSVSEEPEEDDQPDEQNPDSLVYDLQETTEESDTESNLIPDCDCDYAGESGLSGHTDSCARKSFVRNELIKNYSTEELYAMWDGLESEIQEAVLTFLSWDDYSKYTELKDLLDNGPAQGGEEEEDEDLIFDPVKAGEGLFVGVFAPAGSFPAGTEVEITPVFDVDEDWIDNMEGELVTFFEDKYTVEYLDVKMMDITFTGNDQPACPVYVTFELDGSEIDEDANMLAIFHFDEDGNAELMAVQRLYDQDDVSVTVEADHFSHYAVMTSKTEYQATLMRDYLEALEDNDRYSIVEFPVTLNDFDAEVFNNNYDENGLRFTTGEGGIGMNGGNAAATQGIVGEWLQGGYPVTNGRDRGYIFFDGNSYENSGKDPHGNIPFEFIYDAETGYYTYNSGANHAQFNYSITEPKVELYADTIAPYNYLYSVFEHGIYGELDDKFTTGDGISERSSTSDGTKKITVLKPKKDVMFYVYQLGNLPYGGYDSDSQSYRYYPGHFYLRLRSNHDGTIRAKVTYETGDPQYISLALEKDVWADYIFGEFDNTRKITGIEFYLPDAEANDYVEYSIAGFLKTGNPTGVNVAGFYPFHSNIKNSFGGFEAFTRTDWEERIETGDNAGILPSRTIYNTELKNSNDVKLSDEYAYFAMAMEVEFYIPLDGKNNGEDIAFHFNGDDDMWVFVDDQLALDIGGAHIAVEGSINFTNGDTYVSNRRSITDTKAQGAKEDRLDERQYKKGEYHTLKIFYMERAGTNSNCLIKFNLPLVPTGAVAVEKTVVEEGVCNILEDLSFTFTAAVDGAPCENAPYTLYTKDENGIFENPVDSQTGADGSFQLKDGQRAVFQNIPEGSSVTVTETNCPEKNAYYCKSTTVNGEAGNGKTLSTSAGSQAEFFFENTYVMAYTSLTITKALTGEDSSLEASDHHSFLFHVVGDKDDPYTSDVDLTVVIDISEEDKDWTDSITITNLLVGDYTVTEDTGWSWRFTLKGAKNREINLVLDSSRNKVTFVNDLTKNLWFDDSRWKKNRFGKPNQ